MQTIQLVLDSRQKLYAKKYYAFNTEWPNAIKAEYDYESG